MKEIEITEELRDRLSAILGVENVKSCRYIYSNADWILELMDTLEWRRGCVEGCKTTMSVLETLQRYASNINSSPDSLKYHYNIPDSFCEEMARQYAHFEKLLKGYEASYKEVKDLVEDLY